MLIGLKMDSEPLCKDSDNSQWSKDRHRMVTGMNSCC